MKVMGMAASQARFLGLTARKSNVEYQGQQINQQRTALSNESANLYNQMMELNVPTPPSSDNYYKTTYVLTGTGNGYNTSDYQIENMVKTYNSSGEYQVTLLTYEESTACNYLTGVYAKFTNNGASVNVNGQKNMSVVDNYSYTDGIQPDCVYKINEKNSPSGYSNFLALKGEGYNGTVYFYQLNGINYFMDENELKSDSGAPVARNYTAKTPITNTVNAYLNKSSTGRYTEIVLQEDLGTIKKDTSIALDCTREFDQEGYDDATNDYYYQKQQYEKAIDDINAKTEILQGQDQQLELRLQQLNTEQSAIATEIDAVSKVISDNVEKTFNTFG